MDSEIQYVKKDESVTVHPTADLFNSSDHRIKDVKNDQITK